MGFRSEDYCVLYRRRKDDRLPLDKKLLNQFVALRNPFGHWCADPFPIEISGKDYIFAEIGSNLTRVGKIGYVCLQDKKPKWKICFSPKFHVSYPNIFHKNGHLYCVPETFNDKCVALYELDDSLNFKQKEILFESPFSVDSSFVDGEPDLLFSYDGESEKSAKYLSLRKMSQACYVLHKIKDETAILRPAGNVFTADNSLVFPTQDCRTRYGGALIFNRLNLENNDFSLDFMTSITEKDIRENTVIKKAVGTHTYNSNNKIEVIDVVISRITFGGILYKTRSKMMSFFRKIFK